MLITFKTKSWANIIMFGEVGTKMLEMMGFGTSVPGAIDVAQVPLALDNLRRGLESANDTSESVADDDDSEPPINLLTRASPLIDLLQSAVNDQNQVRWE